MRIKDILLLQEAPKYATVAWAKPINDSVLLNIYNKGEWHPINGSGNSGSSSSNNNNNNTKTNNIADEFDWIGELPESIVVKNNLAQTYKNLVEYDGNFANFGPDDQWYDNWYNDHDDEPVTVVHYVDDGADIYINHSTGTVITNDYIYLSHYNNEDEVDGLISIPVKYRYVLYGNTRHYEVVDVIKGVTIPSIETASLTDVIISYPELEVYDSYNNSTYTLDSFHIFYLLTSAGFGLGILFEESEEPALPKAANNTKFGPDQGLDSRVISTWVCHDYTEKVDFYFSIKTDDNYMDVQHLYTPVQEAQL